MARSTNSLGHCLVGEPCRSCEVPISTATGEMLDEGFRITWKCRATHTVIVRDDSTFDQILAQLAGHCARHGHCDVARAA